MTGTAASFGMLAGVVAAACTVPYVRDTLRRTTVPHRGSWLIWSVIEVVAVAALAADGAQWSLLPLAVQAAGTCLVLALSVRFGSGGLSRVDLALLGLAAVGVAGWLLADEPVVAVAGAIVADLLAVLMMVPKCWRDPHTETLSTYALAAASGALMVGAVATPTASLLVYPVYFALVNAAVSVVIVRRRAMLARSEVPTGPVRAEEALVPAGAVVAGS